MYLSLWPNTAWFGELRGFCQLLPAFSIWCGQKYLSVPTSPQVSCNSWQLLSLVVTHKFAEPAPGLPHYLYFQRVTSHAKCKQSHAEDISFHQPFVLYTGKCLSMVSHITFHWQKLLTAPQICSGWIPPKSTVVRHCGTLLCEWQVSSFHCCFALLPASCL